MNSGSNINDEGIDVKMECDGHNQLEEKDISRSEQDQNTIDESFTQTQQCGLNEHQNDLHDNDNIEIKLETDINSFNEADQVNESPSSQFNSNPKDYREADSLVAYSDSGDDSDSSSVSSPEPWNGGSDDSNNRADLKDKKKEGVTSKQSKLNSRLRSNGEVFPEELPPIDYLTISADEQVELIHLGNVAGIVGTLVVVKSREATPALYDDSVLFLENRQPLGLIFETLGTVEKPFYSVRFNSAKDIEDRGIHIGDKVMYAPKADNLTKYVFISELRKIKCDDASWENDNEPPDGAREFSDDEEERMAKRAKNAGKRKRANIHVPSDTGNKVGLKQGDLTKNPFGDRKQKFGGHSSTQWPPPEQQKRNHKNKSMCWPPDPSSQNPSFNRSNPQHLASFGGIPSWPSQSRSMETDINGGFPRFPGSDFSRSSVPNHRPFFMMGPNRPPLPRHLPSDRLDCPQFPMGRGLLPDFSLPPPPMMNNFGPTNRPPERLFMNHNNNNTPPMGFPSFPSSFSNSRPPMQPQ